jgi:hypothetical protein
MIPILSMLGMLAGCAGPMPKQNPHDAWIGLREEPDAVLMAADLDGKRLDDGRYFQVKPGKHHLDMTLVIDGVGDNDEQNCDARINYDKFAAGGQYKLVENSLGENYSVKLEDAQGKQLGHSASFTCMPS